MRSARDRQVDEAGELLVKDSVLASFIMVNFSLEMISSCAGLSPYIRPLLKTAKTSDMPDVASSTSISHELRALSR